jgi:site-specific DNA-methyltransferase (adenine-specific)
LQEKREMTYQILLGNNLDILPTLADNSIDSIVTDPPYELGFMGKKWDSSGIAYSVELWQQCLRVLKPGGHLLSFGGTRTYHRVAVAIEDAGFELRDSIAWLYGSGFPKSFDVSKAIDKAAGAEREVIGYKESVGYPDGGTAVYKNRVKSEGSQVATEGMPEITAPSTPEAQQWQGWGTALKPAFEPVIVARKPIEGTVANNVLKWGTGGLNIDGSRIGSQGGTQKANPQPESKTQNAYGNGLNGGGVEPINAGRWPANIILDPYTAELLDEQSGQTKSGNIKPHASNNTSQIYGNGKGWQLDTTGSHIGDSGGASRFFYVAKASKRDRNEGLEELQTKQTVGGGGLGNPVSGAYGSEKAPGKNFHPTVKPTSLMEYLIKLVTPPPGHSPRSLYWLRLNRQGSNLAGL